MLTVLEYDKNKVKYKCKCDCGNITYPNNKMLLHGASISCGCSKIKYLPGQKINNIELLERIDSVHWKCRCHCGKEFITMTSNLVKGHTMSCGCQRLERFQATMKERYGEVSYAKVDTDRTPEQLQWVDNRENFRNFLQTYFNHKPSQQEVMRVIGLNQANTRKVIDRFDSWDLIDNQLKVQSYEKELWDLFPGSKVSDRKTLGGRELDMLFQSKGIAIEFNGDYWHSEFYKSINNHAYKQKACRVQGINLIHLYEHEFEDQQIKDKCIALVRCALNDESNIDLTDIEAKIIDSQTAEKFIADNSLYEYRDECINIGLADKAGNIKILAQVSRSDNKATIYNITWDIKLTGGVQKLVQMLMTSIIKLINLDSLEVILDFDKLSWIKMGQQFKDCQILQPGYVWINTEGHKIKVINHTKCKEMIENNEVQTEDDLYRLNYCKLYNSGYLKYIWSI